MSTALAQREQHVVYRLFDHEGALLYVGLTSDLMTRMRRHSRTKEWWQQVDIGRTRIDRYLTREAAVAAEVAAIVTESPLYNVSTHPYSRGAQPAMVMKSHRYPEDLYNRAAETAADRGERLSDVLRAALEQYVKEDE